MGNGPLLAVVILKILVHGIVQFSEACPCPRLYHINGNAIYNVQHPWLQYLLAKLLGYAVSKPTNAEATCFMLEGPIHPPWNHY